MEFYKNHIDNLNETRHEILTKSLSKAGLGRDAVGPLMKREETAPTYVGFMIAIPHCVYGKSDRIIYSTLERKVQWGNKPAETVNKLIIVISGNRKRMKEVITKTALLLHNEPRSLTFKRLKNEFE